METFLGYIKYFDNMDYIKYGAIFSIIWLFLYKFLNLEFNLNFVIRTTLFCLIVYYLLNKDFNKKKLSEGNLLEKIKQLENYNLKNETVKMGTRQVDNIHFYPKIKLKFMKNNNNLILLYANNLELRDLNLEAFNNSLLNCEQFLELEDKIYNSLNPNYQQLEDLLKNKKTECLNQFASININIITKHLNYNYNKLIIEKENKIKKVLTELETILTQHQDKIEIYLEKKYYNQPLTFNSYPKHFLDNHVNNNITTTNDYSRNYSVY